VPKLARVGLIESRVEFEAGPAANDLGPRAVLRRHALRAARQRTLEANGIDCGAGRVSAVRLPRARLSTSDRSGGRLLRANDERDAREVDGDVLLEALLLVPAGHCG